MSNLASKTAFTVLTPSEAKMRKNYPRFTLRISDEMLQKIGSIASNNGRTKNKEIEFLLKRHIAEYERLYGPIKNDLER